MYLKFPSREAIKRKHTTAHTQNCRGTLGGTLGATGLRILGFPACNPPCVRRREFENPQSEACGKKQESLQQLIKTTNDQIKHTGVATETWSVLAAVKGDYNITMYDVKDHFVVPWTKGTGSSIAVF